MENFFFLKDQESNEIKYELHKSKRYENKIIRENSFYESSNRHMVLLYLNIRENSFYESSNRHMVLLYLNQ